MQQQMDHVCNRVNDCILVLYTTVGDSTQTKALLRATQLFQEGSTTLIAFIDNCIDNNKIRDLGLYCFRGGVQVIVLL